MKLKLWIMLGIICLLVVSCDFPPQRMQTSTPTPPTLIQTWIDAPLSGATLPLESYTIVFHAASTTGVKEFEVSINGFVLGSVAPLTTGSGGGGGTMFYSEMVWEPLAPGGYLIAVRAKNSADQYGASVQAPVTIEGQISVEMSTPLSIKPSVTPTRTNTPTIHYGPTPTPTPTPVRAAPGDFGLHVTEYALYRGGCSPRQTTFTVEVMDPEEVFSVVLFTRVQDKVTGERTNWGEGVFSMEEQGNGWFALTLIVDDIPDHLKYDETWLQYQLVAINADSEVLWRSQTYGDISILKCGAAPPPPPPDAPPAAPEVTITTPSRMTNTPTR